MYLLKVKKIIISKCKFSAQSFFGIILFFLFFIFFSFTASSELNILNLPDHLPSESDQIWKQNNQFVKIRGFWYPIPEKNQGMLTIKPNLKSCCISSETTLYQQIIIDKNFLDLTPGQAITVTGIFSIQPNYDESHGLKNIYHIYQAEIVPTSFINIKFFWIVITLIIGALYYLWHYLRIKA